MRHKYVNIAALNYNKSYHATIGREPSRVFHGRLPIIDFNLEKGICPQKMPSTKSQIAQDVLEQTEMIFQDVRKKDLQSFIKYNAYSDRKANVSKHKQADYVYVLQPKSDHQGSGSALTEHRRIGPFVIKKALPNNNYLVRKVGTYKAQVLRGLRLRQFTPRQPILDVQIRPRLWNCDPELIKKHDNLYARAWERDYEKTISDNSHDNAVLPNSYEISVASDLPKNEMSNNPGTIRKNSPEFFFQADKSCDITDTDHYMEPDTDTSVEQKNPTPTNPRNSKYDLRHKSGANCNDDHRY